MDRKHAELYERIQQFRIDEPGSSLTFIQRLARDNLWTLEFAWRVVEEYKRFAFLAVAAGHPVTPSETIDEAWHLHLLYTRSYWDKFCPQVLGKTLHHDPTRGGDAERAKHADWYAKTLASYETFFGPPPADIWPRGNSTSQKHAETVHVPRDRFWIVPKRPVFSVAKLGLASMALCMVGAAPIAAIENPLNMSGKDFLSLYLILFVLALGAGFGLRWLLRAPFMESARIDDDQQLHPYEMAWLAGGKDRVIDAALSHLVHTDVLKLNSVERSFDVLHALPANAHPFDKRVVNVVQQDGSAKVVRAALSIADEPWLENLRDRALILPKARARLANLLPSIMLFTVGAIGIAKIVVGLSRGRPVGNLLLLVIGTFIAAFLLTRLKTDRSRFGDKVLRGAKKWHAELQKPQWNGSPLDPLSVAMGVALFSSMALAGGPWNDLRGVLSPPPPLGGGNSGCGGSSCGGGGGCGGGGCGGCSS